MAIVEYASIFLFQGTAAERATAAVVPGARFYETDTGIMYIGSTAGWIGGTPSIFSAYDSAGGTTVDGTARTVPLGSTKVSDAAYSLSSGEVTISVAGLYWVTADFGIEQTNTSGGARNGVRCWVDKDTGGGWVVGAACWRRRWLIHKRGDGLF